MTHFVDLEPCTYFGYESADLLAVGWLTAAEPYTTGNSDPNFFEVLSDKAKSPWMPCFFMGFHGCELCQFQPARGAANIFFPHRGKIYVAPDLIVHYIAAHHYLPPDDFVEAVMACPDMKSMEYKKAILKSGGKALLDARPNQEM
jgi:hypothetical protein